MPYAITPLTDRWSPTPNRWSPEDLEAALGVGGAQARGLPPEIRHLVIPFGSGNTAAGILYGLHTHGSGNLEDIMLVGIGPDRFTWLQTRLETVGADAILADVRHIPLHPWYATYADVMHETADGIAMHPTYEGKVVRYLNRSIWAPWHRRDSDVGFWIVGGPS